MREKLTLGFYIFFGLALIGLIRLVTAQHAVSLTGIESDLARQIQLYEMVVYAAYYGMMALITCVGAMVSFNLLLDRLEGQHAVAYGATCGVDRPANEQEIGALRFGKNEQIRAGLISLGVGGLVPAAESIIGIIGRIISNPQ
ncbi:MAG: hypothetical protein IPM64_02535 [Phycisphaerales bacterium]|nr:hypothetical protein [Phycisphaerales bacterium]